LCRPPWLVLKPEYVAQSRLLVLLDPEDQAPGAAGSGGAFTLDQVLQSEAEILNSETVRRLAIERQGANPDAATLKALRDGFAVERAPNASVLQASYAGETPVSAANVLNAIVDAYLAYRHDGRAQHLRDQRETADGLHFGTEGGKGYGAPEHGKAA